MADRTVKIDVTQMEEFFSKMGAAGNGDFKKEVTKFLETLAEDFLAKVQDAIINEDFSKSTNLVSSFKKGEKDNIWILSSGGTTLEVGTNVKYAAYVNDGHWTNKKGVERRWVPGYWDGEEFVYVPGAKTGMLLKQQWVEGKHFWEDTINLMELTIPKYLEAKMDSWLAGYFGI